MTSYLLSIIFLPIRSKYENTDGRNAWTARRVMFKINLISSHSRRVSWAIFEFFGRRPSNLNCHHWMSIPFRGRLWCNGYRRRKWTRRHEFKSWTRLIAFHIALIPLRLGFPALGRLGSSTLVRQLVLEKENSEFQPIKLYLKIDLVSYPARADWLVNMDILYRIYKHFSWKFQFLFSVWTSLLASWFKFPIDELKLRFWKVVDSAK